jgi:opacity protein-like surface antigen
MRISFLALGAVLFSTVSAAADCTSEVNEAFAKLRKNAAFNMQTTIVNEQGKLTMSNDYVMPDRMHQRVSLSTQGPRTMEMILIGDKAWSNHGEGWAPLPPQFAEEVAKQMKETVADPPEDVSSYECLGDVEFEGKTYAAYRAARPAKKEDKKVDKADGKAEDKAMDGAAVPAETPNVQTVYIDKETGLPARNIVTPKQDPKKRLFDGTFSLRDGLAIDPPKS